MNRQILVFITITAALVAVVGVLTFVDIESKGKTGDDSFDGSGIEEITKILDSIDFLQGYDESEAKERMSDRISSILTVIQRNETEENKDIKIDGVIHVRNGETYTLGHGNTYSFAKGSIDVQEGGTLILGSNFVIIGDPAVFNLSKGSAINIMGSDMAIPINLSLKINGSMAYRFTLTSNVTATSAYLNMNGYSDLDGSVSFGPLKIDSSEGREFSMKMSATITLDPSSVIKNVLNIPKHEFEMENGVDLRLDIEELNVNIGPKPLYARVNVSSTSVICGSPLSSKTFNISKLDAEIIDVKIGSNVGLIDNLELTADSVKSEIKPEGLQLTITNAIREVTGEEIDGGGRPILGSVAIKGNIAGDAKIILKFGERLNITITKGSFDAMEGEVDANIEIKATATANYLNARHIGDLTVRDGATFSSFLNVPFRRDSHIVIEEQHYDFSFAEDQEAYLKIIAGGGLTSSVEIIAEESRSLYSYDSGGYVHYTVDVTGSGIPDSPIDSGPVTFYAVLGEREYSIYLDTGEILKGTAGTVVDLPIPDSVDGKDFIGWTDSIGIYRDKYTIPTLSLEMTGLWASKTNAPAVDSGKCTISSDSNTIVISGTEMDALKTRVNSGEFETLVLSTDIIKAEIGKDVLLSVSGSLRFNMSYVVKLLKPEWAKFEGSNMMLNVRLEDDEGSLDRIHGQITISVVYDHLDEQYDGLTSYSVADDGELTELGCSYEIKTRTDTSYEEDIPVRYADMKIDTYGSQFILLKPYDAGTPVASKSVLIFALIAIAATGIILAWITKRE